MNSPGSPMPRGRGRGRQKEISASERVTQWVNLREAKRLNKERWANRGSGDNSSAGNESQESDVQMSAKQEGTEPDSGSDRSMAKRNNVRLYVPPSLRAKKESETIKNSHDLEVTSSSRERGDNEDVFQKSGTAYKTEVTEENYLKSKFEDQQQNSEIRRTKQRGRGRKKPEVEIYVPRALRTVKHESKHSVGIQSDSGPRRLPLAPQDNRDPINCDNNVNINSLTVQASYETPAFSEELISGNSRSDIQYQEHELYSKNDCFMQHDFCDSQTVLEDDLTTKKTKYELTESTVLPSTTGGSAPAKKAPSDEHLCLESSGGNSLTFEFYDPAVIAYLPSSHYVQDSYETNTSSYEANTSSYEADTSFSKENSRQDSSTSKVPNSLPQNGTEYFSLSNSTDIQPPLPHEVDECQSVLSSITKEVKNNLPFTHAEEEYSHRKKHSADVGLHEKDEFFIEQTSVMNTFVDENEKIGTNTGNDDSLNSEITLLDSTMSGNSRTLTLSEGVIAIPHNNDGTNLVKSKDLIDVPDKNSETRPESFESISSVIQQASPTLSNQPVPPSGVDKQLLKTEISKSDNKQKDKVHSDLVEDDGDTWDSLFDDNGDCLDEAIITELTEYVGKVEIDRPKINYLNYEPKEAEMDFHEFSHILEIYDFSSDLATCDLVSAFREFSSRGFDVKWVDDTHALGIFSSSVAANEALRMIHPLLKVRPLSEASKKGQSKARHCQEFLQPYKARPETTSIAARRLVAGALGMNPQVSREVRERERQKLKEAKEKRRQERQQKVDVWDGSFGKCAMDED